MIENQPRADFNGNEICRSDEAKIQMEQKGFPKKHRVKNNETCFPCIYEVKYSKEVNQDQ